MNKFLTEFNEVAAVATLAGDTAVLGTLITAYERRVFSSLGRMGFDQTTTSDLTQDIHKRVWRHRGNFDPLDGTVIDRLFGIALNVALAACVDEGTPNRMRTPNGASHALERSQQRDLFHRALQQESNADRTAIALSYIDDYSAQESATLLNCRADPFRARLSRTRQRLATELEETA